MTIIFDLDDVIANLRESLYQMLMQDTGVDLHWRHWSHYDLLRHYNLSYARLTEILIRSQVLENCQPEPGAAAVTQALRAQGFELAIVTARGWHPQALAITDEWLRTHGVSYDHLHIVPLGSDKREVLKPFANIVLAVDDHPHNITRYVAANIPAVLVDRPWNVDFAHPERIQALAAVLDYVTAAEAAAPDH